MTMNIFFNDGLMGDGGEAAAAPPVDTASESVESTVETAAETAVDTATTEAESPSPPSFDMDAWTKAGSDVNQLPSEMRALYNLAAQATKAANGFNAAQAVNQLFQEGQPVQQDSLADKLQKIKEDTRFSPTQVQDMIQREMHNANIRDTRQKFIKGVEDLLSKPVVIANGAHTGVFTSQEEVTAFHNFIKDTVTKRALSPEDLYKLYAFDKIIADVGEHHAVRREEKLRKAGGSKSTSQPPADTKQTPAKSERDKSVEEIFREKFPDAYAKLGNNPFA